MFLQVVWVYFHKSDDTYIQFDNPYSAGFTMWQCFGVCECAYTVIQECVEIPVISMYFFSYWIFLYDYCIISYWIKFVYKFSTGKMCYYNPYCSGFTYKRTLDLYLVEKKCKITCKKNAFLSLLSFFSIFYGVIPLKIYSLLPCCLFLAWVLFVMGMVHRD